MIEEPKGNEVVPLFFVKLSFSNNTRKITSSANIKSKNWGISLTSLMIK